MTVLDETKAGFEVGRMLDIILELEEAAAEGGESGA